jgi:hypothetical protein
MTHPIYRVAHFDIIGPYTLAVAFTDGTEHQIDFRPVLNGMLFGPLRELAIFNAVKLDPDAGTLSWPNGADFDPAALHDWPRICDELAARARGWTETVNAEHPRADCRMEPTPR